jgi:hypothetical protein
MTVSFSVTHSRARTSSFPSRARTHTHSTLSTMHQALQSVTHIAHATCLACAHAYPLQLPHHKHDSNVCSLCIHTLHRSRCMCTELTRRTYLCTIQFAHTHMSVLCHRPHLNLLRIETLLHSNQHLTPSYRITHTSHAPLLHLYLARIF